MLAIRAIRCTAGFHRSPCSVTRNLRVIATNPVPRLQETATTTPTTMKSKSTSAHCVLARKHHHSLNSFHNDSHVVSLATRHLTGFSIRCSSSNSINSSSHQKVSGSAVIENGFKIFYTFPYIRTVRFLSRLKIYQTFITVLLVPGMTVLYTMGYAELFQVFLSCGTATFASFMLWVISRACMRVAGYLSLSLDGSTLRVSHLDFWGKRKDSYIPVEEVMPLGDTAETINDTYMKLIQHDAKDVYYYSLRYGRVKDRDAFETVFGQIM